MWHKLASRGLVVKCLEIIFFFWPRVSRVFFITRRCRYSCIRSLSGKCLHELSDVLVSFEASYSFKALQPTNLFVFVL